MSYQFKDIVSTEGDFEDLRSTCGSPSSRAVNKVIHSIDHHCRTFIAKSPFLTMATSNVDGTCDVTPRGDKPGFVMVLSDHHLFIPERPGNKRLDSAQNIFRNPHASLLFIIPGLRETLRVNGKAYLCRDQELLEQSAVDGRQPLFGVGIEVEECYLQCAKAFIRSELWNPGSWLPTELLPQTVQMLVDHSQMPGSTVAQVAKELNESYVKRLY